MAQPPRNLPHLRVEGSGKTEKYTRPPQKIETPPLPVRNREQHADALALAIGRAIEGAHQEVATRDAAIAEGPPDLIVEIVSDSSVRKDTKRLPKAYWQAGVLEYWLVDARREELFFRIHQRGDADYQPALMDDESYQYSAVLDCWYRLDRSRNPRGRLQYVLREKRNPARPAM